MDFLQMFGMQCTGSLNYMVEFVIAGMLPVVAVAYASIQYKRGKQHVENQLEHQMSPEMHRELLKAAYETLFDTADEDGSGVVDRYELQHILLQFNITLRPTKAQLVIDEIGANDDGNLQRDIFLAGMTNKKLLYLIEEKSSHKKKRKKKKKKKNKLNMYDPKSIIEWSLKQQLVSKSLSIATQLLLLCHAPIARRCFMFFHCHYIDGKYFMRSDYKIECYESTEWLLFLPIVVSVMTGYVVGLPVIIAGYLTKNRERLYTAKIHGKIGFLYDAYSRGAEGWEVHELIRKMICEKFFSDF